MLKVSELVAIQIDHIQFAEDRYALFISKTKIDQTGEGRNVIVYKSPSLHSSFVWLEQYIRNRNDLNNRSLFITRTGKTISSHDVRDRVKHWIKLIEKDPVGYSTHSLRKGGGQTAAFNGAFPSSIKHQGGWRSNCFLTYTAFDEEMASKDLKGKT